MGLALSKTSPAATYRKPSRVSRPDRFALGGLLAMVLLYTAYKWHFDNWLSDQDISTFFMPWFSEMGRRLRQCDIPARNPYLFSGVPFAGDPESGWGFLPAMVLFTAFPSIIAMKLLGLVMLTIASISTYVFGRLVHMSPVGAFGAAAAFTFGPVAFTQTHCCLAGGLVNPLIPAALVGAELALRAKNRPHLFTGVLLASVSLCQILAAWTGQGAVNAMAIVGLWMLFRGVVYPENRSTTLKARLIDTFSVAVLVFALAALLSGAWILPRLAANAESNLAGGHYEGQRGAAYSAKPSTLPISVFVLTSDDSIFRRYSVYPPVAILAMFALVSWRRQKLIMFWGMLVALIVVASINFKPFIALIELVPKLATVHEHAPVRVLWHMSLPLSILAGFGVDQMAAAWRRKHNVELATIGILAFTTLAYFGMFGVRTRNKDWFWISVILTIAVIALNAIANDGQRIRGMRQLSALTRGAAVLLLALFPTLWDVEKSFTMPDLKPGSTSLWANTEDTDSRVQRMSGPAEPNSAAEFILRKRQELQPFRIATVSYSGNNWYPGRRMNPGMIESMQNGRTIYLGIENTAGYNPQKPFVYQTYMTQLNRMPQDYHFENLLSTGVRSPLVDLLNVRYIVLDRSIAVNSHEYQMVSAGRRIVFHNRWSLVFENATAAPRAWMVYDARNDVAGIEHIGARKVDGRETAFLEEDPPALSAPRDDQSPRVMVSAWSEDELSFKVNQSGHGLLVMSEIWSKDWKAKVDGKDARIYRTNTALMSLELTPGEHTITLAYAPASLTQGLVLSGVSAVGSFGGLGYLWWRERNVPTGERDERPPA